MEKIISRFIGKVVFFDFDGVLCPYQSTNECVHLSQDKYFFNHIEYGIEEVYKSSPASKTMRNLVSRLNTNNIYVLTQCASSFEFNNKVAYIRKYYPNIKESNIFFVVKGEHKVKVIEGIYRSKYIGEYSRKQLVMVDDTIPVIESIENEGFSCIHISSLLV